MDEADSVLVDDARTPLMLSQETDVAAEAEWAEIAHGLADRMVEDLHYDARPKQRMIELTARKLAIVRTTDQRYFRRYLKLSGMSGTARELRVEISAIHRGPQPAAKPLIV